MTLQLDDSLRAVGLTEDDLERVDEATRSHADGDAVREAFIELARQGTFGARELVRNPTWLEDIASGADAARDSDELFAALELSLDGAPIEAAYRELREMKRRESLRIFLREVRGASTRQTTAEFADVAEASLRMAVRAVDRARFAGFEDAFCVLGMGKLGGRELNPSSDIDLIFVCDDRASEDDDLRTQLVDRARDVVDLIASRTEDGYVFRVDLRLRPDGSQGPIVMPASAMIDYYLTFGRTWERSALMKARPVAGNLAIGEQVLRGIEPWVFRRTLDFGALEELRAMKAKIEANATLTAVHGTDDEPAQPDAPAATQAPLADRLKGKLRGRSARRARAAPAREVVEPDSDEAGVLGWDCKIGVGGIREIEFFAQALQLVHSGAQPTLRVRGTMPALDALLWAGLITDADHSALADTYDFLRRLEHRIQMAEDRQSHRLPATWREFGLLASRMGSSSDELRDRILQCRDTVREMFERLFASESRSGTGPTLDGGQNALLDLVARAPEERLRSQGTLDALTELGFSRPLQMAGQLEVMRPKKWGPLSETAWGSELALARRIIADAAAAPDPDQAFSHFTRFARAVGDRPGYWAMLADNPHATRLLLQVFGSSAALATALIADPNVFERLLSVGTVAVEKSAARMDEQIRGRLVRVSDPEHRLGVIRRFHREETLRVGLHETGGAARIDQTLEQLSVLAERVIARVLDEVYQPLRSHRRSSTLPALDEIGFAVVAMGKLGGWELGFGSDLDLVFVYSEDRQYKLEHAFFARLAQRLIRTLSTTGAEGKMYEVDTRLRPSGNRGALVVSLDAFRDYYADSAGLWERQALIRARPIAGPESLCDSVREVRERVAFGKSLDAAELGEIAKMRKRVNEAHYVSNTRDPKFGRGGLMDVEFGVQALQLQHASANTKEPDVRSSSTRLASRALTGSDALARDYLWLCRLQARLRMGLDAATTVPTEPVALRTLARRMGHQGASAETAFVDEFEATTSRNHAFYEDVFGMGTT